jgi:hypothetical protein
MAKVELRAVVLGRYTALLLSLLLLMLAMPIFSGGVFGRVIGQVLWSVVLVAGAYAVSRRRQVLMLSIALLIPSFALGWLDVAIELRWLGYVAPGLMVLFSVLVTLTIMRDILTEKDVTLDTIFGSGCVYLLIGIVFAELFMLIHTAAPNSIGGSVAGATSDVVFSELLYYSFVTLTTLGYGDITPTSDLARSTSVFEAILGQFYLTVLVARLVGLHLAGTTIKRG